VNGECCGNCDLEIGTSGVYFVNRRRVCKECYQQDVRINEHMLDISERHSDKSPLARLAAILVIAAAYLVAGLSGCAWWLAR
jgi:hypothetical protein